MDLDGKLLTPNSIILSHGGKAVDHLGNVAFKPIDGQRGVLGPSPLQQSCDLVNASFCESYVQFHVTGIVRHGQLSLLQHRFDRIERVPG